MTAVAGSTFSAAQFNQYVRDNLNETAPAKATAAGQFFVATGANAIAARTPTSATVATSETTTSTSYADLATVGPAATVTTGVAAMVFIKSGIDNNTANIGTFMSFAVSGASSQAAADASAVNIAGVTAANRVRIGAAFRVTGLNAGSNIFTAKYKVASASTGTFTQRDLIVLPF
jgi:hypothetical protein